MDKPPKHIWRVWHCEAFERVTADANNREDARARKRALERRGRLAGIWHYKLVEGE